MEGVEDKAKDPKGHPDQEQADPDPELGVGEIQ